MVRHPAIVSLSTRKWARLRSLGALLDHWFAAHRLFEEDAPFLHHLLVVKYEHLVADPRRTLAEIAAFLELDGDIPPTASTPAAAPPTNASGRTCPTAAPGAANATAPSAAATNPPPTTSATASSTSTAPTRSRSAPPASPDGPDRLQQRPPGQLVARGHHVLGAAQQRPADHAAVLEGPCHVVALEPGQSVPERQLWRLVVLGVQPAQALDRPDHG